MNIHTTETQFAVYADAVAPGDVAKAMLGVELDDRGEDGLFVVGKLGPGITFQTGPLTNEGPGLTQIQGNIEVIGDLTVTGTVHAGDIDTDG